MTVNTMSTTRITRITKVYLSGPMSGLPELNYPTFHAAAHALRRIGCTVVNPAEFETDTTGLDEAEAWRAYMQVDIKALVDCEGIVMLPAWTESRGATLKRNIAQGLGMRVMTVTDAVLEAPIHVEAIHQAATGMAEAA